MNEFAAYPSLRDRVVFVSGGGSGVGGSIVEHFCGQSSRVAFVDVADEASNALAERVTASGCPRPLFIHCDIRDIAALRGSIERVQAELGSIQVLVNNAANDDRHRNEDVTPEYWDDRFAINLRHQFFAAQAVYPQMKAAGGGSIINMGSIVWKIGYGGLPAYSTSKAGICGLTRSLARDYGPDRIRVNTVLPGSILTERQIELWMHEDEIREILGLQCLKESLYPPDVARLVLFLAADDSRMCSSQDFIIDGGWV